MATYRVRYGKIKGDKLGVLATLLKALREKKRPFKDHNPDRPGRPWK